MGHDEAPRTGLIRRNYVKCSGAAVGGGLPIGCTGEDGPESTTNAETELMTETATKTKIETPGGSSYSAAMSPIGTVEPDEPPQSISTRLTHHTKIAFAPGRGDDVNAVNGSTYYDTTWE